MATGRVKFYNSEKGFGFIIPDNGGDDVFVHRTALNSAGIQGVEPDQEIEYEMISDEKNGKLKAESLVLL